MGSSASISPGIANTLQLLSNAGSPWLSSAVSSSALTSALQNASPTDLVQLSDQALQLQLANGLFGDSTTAPVDPLQALDASLFGTTPPGYPASLYTSNPPSSAPPASLSAQLGDLQAQNLEALFGTGPNSALTGNLISTLA